MAAVAATSRSGADVATPERRACQPDHAVRANHQKSAPARAMVPTTTDATRTPDGRSAFVVIARSFV